MTEQELYCKARAQSARDLGCAPEDFLRETPVVVPLMLSAGRKRFYSPDMSALLVSYGNHIAAAANSDCRPVVEAYLRRGGAFYHGFDTPGLNWLDAQLAPLGQQIRYLSEYYLPDPARMQPRGCAYALRVLTDFAPLYLPQWSNALCSDRRELDVLGVGAYDGDTLVGLAACSADADEMWQIGVDVLPDYRRRGIAAAVTSRLTQEILARGKVPFYCTAWANLPSVRNAIRCGFVPAWVELSIGPVEAAGTEEPI